MRHETSGDKGYMLVWRSEWHPPSTLSLPGMQTVQSAPELLAIKNTSDASPGEASCRSMKSTGSGGAQFELPRLRKECEDLRRQLDASTRREQGLAAQVRAQHILRQSRDNKARQQIAVEAPSGTQVSLRPDSSFLEPLLREGADAACIEMLLTAFTYDDPRITECAIEAHSRRALVRLLIDQQKAQACTESGRVLQTLVDSNVEVRTVQGRPLSDVHGAGFRGFRGALHAKTALIRCRAPRADESDRVTLFVGSQNLTRASQSNHECVVQHGTVPSDANVVAHREWFSRLWDVSAPIVIDHGPKPDRRLRAKTPAAGSSVPPASSR